MVDGCDEARDKLSRVYARDFKNALPLDEPSGAVAHLSLPLSLSLPSLLLPSFFLPC